MLNIDDVALAQRGVFLRRQAESDSPFLRALYGAERAAELAATTWDDQAKHRFLDSQFAAQQAHFAVNRKNADFLIVEHMTKLGVPEPIGRLYLDRSVTPWELAELTLIPSSGGRGIGGLLLSWVLAQARLASAPSIGLHVATQNLRAEAFYRRHGFVEVPSRFGSHRRLVRSIEVS